MAQGGSREACRRVGSGSGAFIFESARLRSPALLVCAKRTRQLLEQLARWQPVAASAGAEVLRVFVSGQAEFPGKQNVEEL